MSDIRVRLQGFSKIRGDLRRLDPRDILVIAAETVREQTVRRFASKRSPDGQSWKPSPNGLQDTGRLFGSIRHVISGLSARIGSPLIYAAVHQFGATIRPKSGARLTFNGSNGMVSVSQVTIPARPYLGIGSRDRQEIEQRILGFARRVMS